MRSQAGASKGRPARDRGKRFFPSQPRCSSQDLSLDEKPRKRKKCSAMDGGPTAPSKEELEVRLQELLKKVETLRAKEKKSARARIFHSIGKVRRSLQMYENSGEGRSSRNAPDLSAHSGSEHRCDQDTSSERQRSKRRKQAQAAAPSEKPDPPAAKGPKETRKKMKQRLQLLNKQIAIHGQRKQLTKALKVYEQIRSEGLTPSGYTHTNLINAFVRSGDIDGAMQQLNAMQAAGEPPNVVTYTALIKGMCSLGNLRGAENLLTQMSAHRPPLLPNLRTINTLLRGCVRMGDVDLAYKTMKRMREDWSLVPDGFCLDYLVKLLAQGLRLVEARELLNEAMERGTDSGSGQAFVSLAFAAALTGDHVTARKGLEAFHDFDPSRASEDEGDDGELELQSSDKTLSDSCGKGIMADPKASVALFRSHQRKELEREAVLVEHFLDAASQGGGVDELFSCLLRTFPMDSSLGAEAEGEAGEDNGVDVTAEKVMGGLDRSFGLSQLLLQLQQRQDDRGQKEWTRERVAKRLRIAVKKGQFRWDKIFREALTNIETMTGSADGGMGQGAGDVVIPVKMEICSGTGDWVVAQAEREWQQGADKVAAAGPGRALWVALELRQDRVYQTMTKMALRRVPNLACIAGDAIKVLSNHVPPASLTQVVINFPEPPLWSGGDGESKTHLLTPDFFLLVHAALKKKGTMCILSDNVRYAITVARTIARLTFDGVEGGKKCFKKATVETGVDSGTVNVHQIVEGIPLHCGLPGPECGHRVEAESYFDRLWQHGNHKKRFFLFVRKVGL